MVAWSSWQPALAQTWDGGDGTSTNWSTGANWVGDTAPVSATTTVLTFAGTNNRGTTNAFLNQDIAATMNVSRININTNGFSLGGGTLRFNGNNITNGFFITAPGGSARINNNIELAGLTTFASLASDSEVFYQGNIALGSHSLRTTPGNGGGRRQTFLGNLSGTGNLLLAGGNFTDNWISLSGSNSFSGGVNLDGSGTRVGLRLGSDTALGTGTVNLTNFVVSIVETINGARVLNNNFTVGNPTETNQTAGNGFILQSNSDLTINGTFTLNSRTNTPGAGTNFNKVINVASGSILRLGNVTSAGGVARELRLLGGGGTLEINGDAISLGPISIGDTNTGTTLRLGASGRLSSGNHSGNITNNANFVYNGTKAQTLSGVISGTGTLTQSNTGTLTLSGNNTYAGATTVSAGSLIVNGNQSGATGILEVASGATLGGSGTIGGATTISGTHDPGGNFATQSFASGLSYQSGAEVAWDLAVNGRANRGRDYDGIDVVGGALSFTGPVDLVLRFGGAVDWDDSFWEQDHLGTDGWLIFQASSEIQGSDNLVLPTLWRDSQGKLLTCARGKFSLHHDAASHAIYLNYRRAVERGTMMGVR